MEWKEKQLHKLNENNSLLILYKQNNMKTFAKEKQNEEWKAQIDKDIKDLKNNLYDAQILHESDIPSIPNDSWTTPSMETIMTTPSMKTIIVQKGNKPKLKIEYMHKINDVNRKS